MPNSKILRLSQRRIQTCFLFLLLMMPMAACIAPADVTEVRLQGQKPMDVPTAEYKDVAWLDEKTLAFVHRQPILSESVDRRDNYQISLYRLDTGTWQEVPLPSAPSECADDPGFIQNLRSVPGNMFGYTYLCLNYGVSGILYLWDRRQNNVFDHIHYEVPFMPGEFSFSPDMSVLIQEKANGDGLNNELFRVDADGDMEQLFPEFKRVAAPSWSPDGKSVTFIATERDPHESDGLKTWGQIESLLYHPWDLYLMDANGGNVRVLVPGIGAPYQLRWSPDGQRLYFAGRRPGVEGGIWMLDIDTLEIVRIWPYNTYFNLSPDGQEMVIIVRDEETDGRETYPVLFALPGAP